MNNPRALLNNPVSLLCRVHGRLCAFPLTHVIETLRPLPIEFVPGLPHWILGVSIIRGLPTPVVDLAQLLGRDKGYFSRLVTMRSAHGQVAFAVDSVQGVRHLPPEALLDLPPLLQNVSADLVSGIGTLDSELLLVLSDVALIPDEWWDRLDSRGSES